MPNVLIFTPTWLREDGSYAIHPACEDAINAQKDGFSGRVDWCIGTENPYPIGSHRNVLHQYIKAREIVLADGYYDAMLTVEHDNVMPDGMALQRMYDTDGDVVYAPYQLRHGAFCLNTWQYIGDQALGMPLNNYPDELAEYMRAGTGRICGCGMGCTLFRRHVLEQIPFRGGNDGAQWAPDIPLAQDALRAGFVSMGRFDTPVAHIDGGIRLEAYRYVDKMKVTALQTVNAIAAGEFLRLVAGEQYELTPRAVADLASVGYVVVVPDGPETAMLETPAETAMLPKAKGKRAR